jgi:hypothetical protein
MTAGRAPLKETDMRSLPEMMNTHDIERPIAGSR